MACRDTRCCLGVHLEDDRTLAISDCNGRTVRNLGSRDTFDRPVTTGHHVDLERVLSAAGRTAASAKAEGTVFTVFPPTDADVIGAGSSGVGYDIFNVGVKAGFFTRRRAVVIAGHFFTLRIEHTDDRIQVRTKFVRIYVDNQAVMDVHLDLENIDVE